MLDSLVALSLTTIALLGSPGPATLSLAAVGATYGFQQGIPYLTGILAGLVFAMAGASAGISVLLTQWPRLALLVQIVGAGYICYIAWKIANPAPVDAGLSVERTPGFRDGFVLNLLNPKAYFAFVALFSQFLLPVGGVYLQYFATSIVCFVLVVVIDTAWLGGGVAIKSVFDSPKYAKPMRLLFAVSMVVATLFALISR